MRNINGICRCSCGLAIRAKKLRDWASTNGPQVNTIDGDGIYLVYQQANKDGQGHVYAIINGTVKGNSLGAKWAEYDIQQIYKLQ